jgi:hypothetical protein
VKTKTKVTGIVTILCVIGVALAFYIYSTKEEGPSIVVYGSPGVDQFSKGWTLVISPSMRPKTMNLKDTAIIQAVLSLRTSIERSFFLSNK